MKKWIFVCLLLALILPGCKAAQEDAEQLFRGDTVVNIPLHAEQTTPETQESAPEETAAPTETVPEEPTAAQTASSSKSSGSSGSKSSSSKSSGSKSSGSKTGTSSSSSGKSTAATAATQPAETEPPVTESPVTEPTEPEVYDISGYVPGNLEYAVAEQINTCRAEAGVETLSFSNQLCGIAAVRAYEAGVIWSHSRPSGSGWQSVLSDYGCSYSAAAEELAYVVSYDAVAIVDKWMASESSCSDLLNGAYTTIGVGIGSVNGATVIAVILIG